jgi:E3 ubiquitin-protein ligase BRE1
MLKTVLEERNALKQKLDQKITPSTTSATDGSTSAVGTNEESDALITEIEEINGALNASRDSCTRLQQLLTDREQRITLIQAEKSAIESDLREIREEKNAFALRSEKVQQVLQENEAYIARLEERVASEKLASQKAEEFSKATVEASERALAERDQYRRDADAHKEKASTIPLLEEELRQSRARIEDVKWELSRSEEEVKTLKRRLERAKAALEAAAKAAQSSQKGAHSSFSKSIDEERLEAMTLALRCPVYQHLWRDCVITKCAHMFSRKALEDNLAQRNRKCPSCKNTYSRDDILNVYLYQSNDV